MPTFKRADQEQMDKAKDLLEAGPPREMGFVKSLFFGRLKLDQVLPYPKQEPADAARTDELLSRLDTFMKNDINPAQIDYVRRRLDGQAPERGSADRLVALGVRVLASLGWHRARLEQFCAMDDVRRQAIEWDALVLCFVG